MFLDFIEIKFRYWKCCLQLSKTKLGIANVYASSTTNGNKV